MSWDRYLALPVRRRTAMHIELAEMLKAAKEETPKEGEGSEGEDAPMRQKRFRR